MVFGAFRELFLGTYSAVVPLEKRLMIPKIS